MKTKMFVLICLLSSGILLASLGYSSAQSSSPLSKIGTVNIERVSVECDATKAYTEKIKAEIQKMTAEQDKLNASIQALETELDSGALKIGSQEFFDRNRELAQKKSQLSYLQDFNKQEQGLKSQLWKMDLYEKIIKIASDLGAEKDLYLVLATEQPDLSPQRVDDFANVVRTHKVLYSGGCLDLTDEVIAKMNQQTQAGN